MIRIVFLFGLLCLPRWGQCQYSCGITTERNLFFADYQGRDLGSFAAAFFTPRVGLSTAVLRYGSDIGVKQSFLSGSLNVQSKGALLVQYQQFGNENYNQQHLGTALSLRVGERTVLSSGILAERQRLSDVYGSATTFAGVVSVATKWGSHGLFLGSVYLPFLKPNSAYDKRSSVLFAYGYRFDKRLLMTSSLRLDDQLHFGCSMVYSPHSRIQLAVGNLNTNQRLFGQIALRLGACCWIKQTVLLQRAWGNSYEIGFYYAPKD